MLIWATAPSSLVSGAAELKLSSRESFAAKVAAAKVSATQETAAEKIVAEKAAEKLVVQKVAAEIAESCY